MTIETHCKNGHLLQTSAANAGRMGKCPICLLPVMIPVPNRSKSESDIVGMLEKIEPGKSTIAAKPASKHPASKNKAKPEFRFKICRNCEREIDASYKLCPYCHADLVQNR